MHLDEAIKLENQLYNALKDDELDKFDDLLKVREGLYKSFAAENPVGIRSLLEFRGIQS